MGCMSMEISLLDRVIFLDEKCSFLRYHFPFWCCSFILLNLSFYFFRDNSRTIQSIYSISSISNKRMMDNKALLILNQLMHTIKIFFTKEIISRNKSFIYTKISLNSDLVFIKTLMLILVHNHRIVSEGHSS